MFKSVTLNLMVENVEETIEFYEKKLGFNVVDTVSNSNGGLQFAIFVKDSFTLMVQERTNFIEEYPVLQTEKTQPSISLFIKVDDLEVLYEQLRKTCTMYADIHTTFYDTKEFAITDNNGYVLTFAEKID